MDKYKYIFGSVVVFVAGGLQLGAWYFGHNGTVFAFSSLIIGATAGTLLGFTVSHPIKKK